MKQVLIRGGAAAVDEVPAPVVPSRGLLVRVETSTISAGTERASVQMSKLPLYRRALAQPHHAKRALEVARRDGFVRTYKRIKTQVEAGLPIGYSAAGVVLEAGEDVLGFTPGDRVACAGAGIANHAEVIAVPVNLAVRVPDGVEIADASTVTLGAIALQGVRRAQPTLGETVGVIGLGILGQLTVQLLLANGCRVLAFDLDPERVALAVQRGAVDGSGDFAERARAHTDGFGLDSVIVTAATPSSDPMSVAAQACRRKGRVVIVGDVGLELKRVDLYQKELDVLMSTSYGPGRYDSVYELEGQDYPIGYVRWTENRNMQEYLDLLAAGAVDLSALPREEYEVDAAATAYQAVSREGERPLLVFLRYPRREAAVSRVTRLKAEPVSGKIRVALVGAGSFAQGTHVPNLRKLEDTFAIRAVMSRTGSTARAVAERNGAAYATTSFDEVLADDEVDLVLISTRHDLHAPFTLAALQAGKHVFVEKPLALDAEELSAIEDFYGEAGDGAPLLMTGFNRRFSPAAEHVRAALAGRTTPLVADYRMNAGHIPLDSWVHGPEGGGRNIGEACHVYDLFNSLVDGSRVREVTAQSIVPNSGRLARNDNFTATVSYEDGSLCTLTYTALGNSSYPKERLEVFADNKVLSLDDYKHVSTVGGGDGWRGMTQNKGHHEELEALARALREGGRWPIPLEEQLQAMRIAFAVEESIRG